MRKCPIPLCFQRTVFLFAVDDAQIGMKPGEEISMESALYGMLLASANEVSYAVAENVGKQYLNGGYAEFIEEMNRISQELGCTVKLGQCKWAS